MSADNVQPKRKLIEVALPLAEISRASQADKDRKVGTLKNIHKWFAPMPLPALRALIFAALVDDPDDDVERSKLLTLVRQLVPDTGVAPPADVLEEAANMIRAHNPQLPVVVDPFAGSGSTLVEAQRLGLPVFGADLNPVAALISRAVAELLPPMASVSAVTAGPTRLTSQPFEGFFDDLRHYGDQVQESVKSRVGHLYSVTDGKNPIAWLWTRTAPCLNPACGLSVPLFGSPWLSKQKGREVFVEMEVANSAVRFDVRSGKAGEPRSAKQTGRATFNCPKCGTAIGEKDLYAMGKAGRLALQLMALCLDAPHGRTFVDPQQVPCDPSGIEVPDLDELEIDDNTRDFRTPLYGLTLHTDLYTPRQLVMLAAFADEITKVTERAIQDGASIQQARAIATILGICLSKMAQGNSSLVRWRTRESSPKPEPAFGTQSMPMLWDFAEAYPFGESVGSWNAQLKSIIGAIRSLPSAAGEGIVIQGDARNVANRLQPGSALLVTDPPYFGQINYSGLSDYFYPWLRRALREVHPDLFGTLATPKREELVANPTRHQGSKEAARKYFIDGFTEVFASAKNVSRKDLPIIVVYAHMQDEHTAEGVNSSGWESLLEAVFAADLQIVGTWPIEATAKTRQVGQSANALASYVILICRPRSATGAPATRRSFLAALEAELPEALERLRQASIPPLDLDQAELGPGMAIFSRYSHVLEPSGQKMSVRAAMALVKQTSAGLLWGNIGDLDDDTMFCIKWFQQYGWDETDSGHADSLARGNSTSVSGLVRGGVFWARAGKARLLEPSELTDQWDPLTDSRISVWEVTVRLANKLSDKGIEEAAFLMSTAGQRVDMETVKNVAYAIFGICRDRGWNQTALLFNGLVTSWPELSASARPNNVSAPSASQGVLDFASIEE